MSDLHVEKLSVLDAFTLRLDKRDNEAYFTLRPNLQGANIDFGSASIMNFLRAVNVDWIDSNGTVLENVFQLGRFRLEGALYRKVARVFETLQKERQKHRKSPDELVQSHDSSIWSMFS